jgi:hypothetical protein
MKKIGCATGLAGSGLLLRISREPRVEAILRDLIIDAEKRS